MSGHSQGWPGAPPFMPMPGKGLLYQLDHLNHNLNHFVSWTWFVYVHLIPPPILRDSDDATSMGLDPGSQSDTWSGRCDRCDSACHVIQSFSKSRNETRWDVVRHSIRMRRIHDGWWMALWGNALGHAHAWHAGGHGTQRLSIRCWGKVTKPLQRFDM